MHEDEREDVHEDEREDVHVDEVTSLVLLLLVAYLVVVFQTAMIALDQASPAYHQTLSQETS